MGSVSVAQQPLSAKLKLKRLFLFRDGRIHRAGKMNLIKTFLPIHSNTSIVPLFVSPFKQ